MQRPLVWSRSLSEELPMGMTVASPVMKSWPPSVCIDDGAYTYLQVMSIYLQGKICRQRRACWQQHRNPKSKDEPSEHGILPAVKQNGPRVRVSLRASSTF